MTTLKSEDHEMLSLVFCGMVFINPVDGYKPHVVCYPATYLTKPLNRQLYYSTIHIA